MIKEMNVVEISVDAFIFGAIFRLILNFFKKVKTFWGTLFRKLNESILPKMTWQSLGKQKYLRVCIVLFASLFHHIELLIKIKCMARDSVLFMYRFYSHSKTYLYHVIA